MTRGQDCDYLIFFKKKKKKKLGFYLREEKNARTVQGTKNEAEVVPGRLSR